MAERPMPVTIPLGEITSYLDRELRVAEVPDHPSALNGLQVENTGRVRHIIAAVDASQAAIDYAASTLHERPARDEPERNGGALLLVHHGLFWDGNIPATGRRYRRLKGLLDGDVALYAAHIPLDLHPEVGNNAVLARLLGMEVQGRWGDHRGTPLGVWGNLVEPRDALCHRLDDLLETRSRLIPGGPEHTGKVGIITGAGGSSIAEARQVGIDTFLTGEGAHHTYFDAIEWGLNVIYAGHYATETVGVKALAARVAERFGIPWEFFRQDTGM